MSKTKIYKFVCLHENYVTGYMKLNFIVKHFGKYQCLSKKFDILTVF